VQYNSVTLHVIPPTARWDGNSDGDGDNTSWHDPLNWSRDTLPSPSDDVVIDMADDPVIVHSSGATQIKSLVSTEAIELRGGSLEILNASTIEGDFAVSDSGALIVTSDLVFDGAFTLSGGEVSGTHEMTLNGPFTWSGGTLAGGARTTVAGSGTIEGVEPKFIVDSHTFNNQGTLTWTGTRRFTATGDAGRSGHAVRLAGARYAACRHQPSDARYVSRFIRATAQRSGGPGIHRRVPCGRCERLCRR